MMDLRKKLVGQLALFAAGLMVAACALVVLSLLDDVAEEIEASSDLAELMLAVGEADAQGTGRVVELIERVELRHLTVTLIRSESEHVSRSETGVLVRAVSRWLTGGAERSEERTVALADGLLRIRPDPTSEIREILVESGRMIGIFGVFALVSILAAWRTVDRALQPVRALEVRLDRLARGAAPGDAPDFELAEFRRIDEAIDRLAESLARADENERQLGRRLLGLQEAERRELARELHDEFGQSLSAIGVAAAFIERHACDSQPAVLIECARDIRGEAQRMSTHVRNRLRQLRPHGLDGLGMVGAIEDLLDGWRQRESGVAVEARFTPQLPTLSPEAGLAVYRTLQEALTNISRHSHASRIRVLLGADGDGVVLDVEDDGEGCDEAALQASTGGVLGMRERARMADGRLDLHAARGKGLRIALWVPVLHAGGRIQ